MKSDYPNTRTIAGVPVYIVQSPVGKELEGYRNNLDDIAQMTRGLMSKVSCSGCGRLDGLPAETVRDIRKTLKTYCQRDEYPPVLVIVQNYGWGIWVKDYYFASPTNENGCLSRMTEQEWESAVLPTGGAA